MTRDRNRLLSAVESSVRAQVDDRLRRIDLARGQVLHHQGETIETVYFPEGALIGLTSAMPAGDVVQTAMIGWEGAVGVFEACGSRQSAFLAEVLVEGPAWCLPADDYRRMFESSEALRVAVHKYVEVLLTEARQFVACNALHGVEARLSRSILEALERSRDGRTLPTTQEALAEMLGVQRTTVTAALAALQSRDVVRSARGVIEVLNKHALEGAACCCRETLQMARADIYAADEPMCEG